MFKKVFTMHNDNHIPLRYLKTNGSSASTLISKRLCAFLHGIIFVRQNRFQVLCHTFPLDIYGGCAWTMFRPTKNVNITQYIAGDDFFLRFSFVFLTLFFVFQSEAVFLFICYILGLKSLICMLFAAFWNQNLWFGAKISLICVLLAAFWTKISHLACYLQHFGAEVGNLGS